MTAKYLKQLKVGNVKLGVKQTAARTATGKSNLGAGATESKRQWSSDPQARERTLGPAASAKAFGKKIVEQSVPKMAPPSVGNQWTAVPSDAKRLTARAEAAVEKNRKLQKVGGGK